MGIIALSIVILLPVLFFLLLPVIALVDILRSKFPGNDNILLALLVVFVPFGAVVYFVLASSRKLRN
ncbi:MAG TPA: hypothetical protein VK152_06955 [Paludibacter sp.]|nr:hypothetical protein [Paludibacter sp.]